MTCWLCQFGLRDCPFMRGAIKFIIEASPLMHEDEVVIQVERLIKAKYPEASITQQEIRTHITQHMVHPNIILPKAIRELNHLASEVRSSMLVHDPETNCRQIDEKQAKLYLSTITQISNILKIDKLKYPNVTGE